MKLIYNPLIDGLRALAVISIILFHLEVIIFDNLFFSGGFIGVDIFLVISGYLISKLILFENRNNSFSISTFFFKRLRRLSPLLLVVLICSILIGFFTQFPNDFYDLSKNTVSSSLFFSNIDYFFEDNYFASAFKNPLLHTWSLSLEVQLYLSFTIIFILFCKNLLTTKSIILLALILIISLLISNSSNFSSESNFI